MKRNQMLYAASISVAFLVVAVTATASLSHTPLYTYRMEQVSSEKNFLPTAVNEFFYNTESGVTITYEVGAYCNAVNPLVSDGVNTCETCPGHITCYSTCPETCGEPSCWGTCFEPTCDTCTQPTCETCETCVTCSTCGEPTCDSTCPNTCGGQHTCKFTCDPCS